jgi:hypothetical protein
VRSYRDARTRQPSSLRRLSPPVSPPLHVTPTGSARGLEGLGLPSGGPVVSTSPTMHPVGTAGFDLRGAAGAVVGDRRVIGAKRRSGAICPTVVPPRRRGGGRSFRRSAGFSSAGPAAVTPNAVRHHAGGRKPALSGGADAAPRPPPSPERRTSGGRRCRECARHRHFRALGPFGARLITPKLTLDDLRQLHGRS